MDERLSKALEFANYSVTINNKKKLLKEKFQEDMIVFVQGSQFTITKELINFVNLLVEKGNTEDTVLIDDNGIPVLIKDLEDFLASILDQYFQSANKYHEQYIDLSKKRSVEKLIDE